MTKENNPIDYMELRTRDAHANSSLEEIKSMFPWIKKFKIDPHALHVLDVMYAILEIKDIGGNELFECLSFFRLVSVSGKKEVNSTKSESGLRLSMHYSLKSTGDIKDPSVFSSALNELKTSIYNNTYRSTICSDCKNFNNSIPDINSNSFDLNPDRIGFLEVIKKESLKAIETLIDFSDGHDMKKLQSVVMKIKENMGHKRLAKISSESLFNLQPERFPNFSDFFIYLKGRCVLAEMGDGVFSLPPILLVGEPGIGKTAFLSKLSKVIDTEFLSINMAAAHTGSILSGSDIHWSNNRQGELFNKLVYGKAANPIVFLDELDKINKQGNYDPSGSLYMLLERATASKFEDLSLPGAPIDASRVVWFAAANKEDSIEPALLSRFKVFNIPVPRTDQMPEIVKSVFLDLIDGESWGDKIMPLSDDVLHKMTNLPPRDVRKILEDAILKAVIDGRFEILPSDINVVRRKSAIGF